MKRVIDNREESLALMAIIAAIILRALRALNCAKFQKPGLSYPRVSSTDDIYLIQFLLPKLRLSIPTLN